MTWGDHLPIWMTLPRCWVDDSLPQTFHNELQLVCIILPGEQRLAGKKLCQQAP